MAKKKEAEKQPEQTTETVEATETVETPEVNPWEEKYNEEREAHLRLAADYDNYRKRTIKEKDASYGNGKADAVAKILPIYDNLERALNQPCTDEAYKKGVEMTMTELKKIFESLGVEIYGEVGETFDPNIHNAVFHVEDDAFGDGEIVEVFQKGYRKGKHIIRFAMVKTAN